MQDMLNKNLLQDAIRAIAGRHFEHADQLLDRVLSIDKGNVEAYRLKGISALISGRREKAIDYLKQALHRAPQNISIQMTYGSALVEMGATSQGLTHLKEACRLAPQVAEAWHNLGVGLQFAASHEFLDELDQAREAFERAVALNPAYVKARNKLAETLAVQGKASAAIDLLRDTISRFPECVEAWTILANLKMEKFNSEDVDALKHLVARPGLDDESRMRLEFVLVAALEDIAAYGEAFEFMNKANVLRSRAVHWSREVEKKRVESIGQAFSSPNNVKRSGKNIGEEIIFIVSLPRSGSTLTEQIFASHPEVVAAGETGIIPKILHEESNRKCEPLHEWSPKASPCDWQRLGEKYLRETRKLHQEKSYLVDKTVENWAFVGFIASMLPGAHIINARRDALETCLACYKENFYSGCEFSYNLEDMVAYYSGYARLSAIWSNLFPSHFMDSSYEGLQNESEKQIRSLLNFCGLPFSPRCLKFHETKRDIFTLSALQVRHPIWRRAPRGSLYGEHIDSLRQSLGKYMGTKKNEI